MTFGAGYRREPGLTANVIAGAALTSVIAWNVVTYPAVLNIRNFEPWVDPFVGIFNLKQGWYMFAPAPYYNDWWLIGDGVGSKRASRQPLHRATHAR